MTTRTDTEGELAISGGPPCVEDPSSHPHLFHWPIVTAEDEQAVLDVIRDGASPSGCDISMQFEKEFAEWMGVRHALSYPNGTMAIYVALWAAGIGRSDEVIIPSMTYWASAMPVFSLGATPVFADIDPDTLCIDPEDIEQHISPHTKAILPVHWGGYPADMDAIVTIAEKHDLTVIEDVSHAQGTLYKGRRVGTFGRVNALSMMSGKSFAVGEGGMLLTDDQSIYERAIAFAHYSRHDQLDDPALKAHAGVPLGGIKGRMNQTCAAMGRGQLKHYPARIKEIQAAMNRFWDLLEGTPGIRAHRPPADSGSTMGGWYAARGLYRADELGGLSCTAFCEAVRAEGVGDCWPGANSPLHRHPALNDVDIYGDGKPTRIANSDRDLRQPAGSLPVSENIFKIAFGIPWFKHDEPELIAQYATAYRKVALQADKLI
jgi:dTDP-4-amino-4,6-dideoxygalactose transaminase